VAIRRGAGDEGKEAVRISTAAFSPRHTPRLSMPSIQLELETWIY
jgi:hypothetical protein